MHAHQPHMVTQPYPLPQSLGNLKEADKAQFLLTYTLLCTDSREMAHVSKPREAYTLFLSTKLNHAHDPTFPTVLMLVPAPARAYRAGRLMHPPITGSQLPPLLSLP